MDLKRNSKRKANLFLYLGQYGYPITACTEACFSIFSVFGLGLGTIFSWNLGSTHCEALLDALYEEACEGEGRVKAGCGPVAKRLMDRRDVRSQYGQYGHETRFAVVVT